VLAYLATRAVMAVWDDDPCCCFDTCYHPFAFVFHHFFFINLIIIIIFVYPCHRLGSLASVCQLAYLVIIIIIIIIISINLAIDLTASS
jgi:hypothetical protein